MFLKQLSYDDDEEIEAPGKEWEKVKVETVIKSFKKCGISNAMDRTEDDLLWDTDDDEEIERQAKNGSHMTSFSMTKVRIYWRSYSP